MTKPTVGRNQFAVKSGELEKETPQQRNRSQTSGRITSSEGTFPRDQQRSSSRGKNYAQGGDTPMAGKGDRTRTDVPDSAGPQTAGITSSKAKANPKFIEGGSKPQATEEGEGTAQRVRVAGGLALKAWPGSTGPRTDAVEEGEQHWRRGKRI